jgi:hypothetical protein
VFRRTKAYPENNNAELGGESPRDGIQHQLSRRGIRIENAGPPPAGVTRLLGQGLEGLRGLFKNHRNETGQ